MNLPIDNPPIETAGSLPSPLPSVPPDLVRTWVHGWTRCRGTAGPVAVLGGFHVVVGLPDQPSRYVFPTADLGVLRELTASITTPNLWIKVCVPREEIAPVLPAGWEFGEPQFLMSTALPASPTPPEPPAGYTVETVDEDGTGVIDCRVLDAATGSLAARGRAGITDASSPPSVIYDMINTSTRHRRRGLGSLVMNALSAHAVELGAAQGVLVASPAGQALYRSLGWSLHAPVTAVRIPPPTNGDSGSNDGDGSTSGTSGTSNGDQGAAPGTG
ncbi:GNAT family N-acetyltransferase [Streptomyces sp. NPDC059788]|uniref:GNAT family N-acetyltransferase n=1 Tax=Streptomyces sp. NPDC059788 TaxID=3346948 RepID=UPI0036486428